MKRQRAERGGRRGETIAALWLQLKGWRILGRRVRTPVGEIDLVARRAFTSTKATVRPRRTQAEADLSLDEYRLRRVAAAAAALSPRYAKPNDDIRIDAMFIVPRRLPRHLSNVWQG